ncbi:hypothetical protein [Candidatus Chlorohelix sp.]|uniref:ArnT family glycosyltransferase n=1 Tax=Candidatus Chlorohelix sp. TaxID=3139201 RepID=UPI00303FA80A
MILPSLDKSEQTHKTLYQKVRSFKFQLSQLLWLALLLLLLPRLGSFFSHSWSVLNWEWQIDYDEGFNLDAAWKLSKGTNIYGQATLDRFIAAPYPPFYYLLCAIFLKVFGIGMLGGRLISFASALAIGVFLGLLTRWQAISLFKVSNFNGIMAGIAASFIWLSINPTQIWGTFYKQDMLAMALAMAGLWLVGRWDEKNESKVSMYGAAILLALAFYTKQNELAACGVAIAYLLLKGWRKSWRFGVALLAMLVIPLLVLDLLTLHRFYFYVFEAQQVPWIADDFWRRLTQRIIPDHLTLVIASLLPLAVEFARAIVNWRKRKWYAPQLVTIWFAGGAFTLITVGSYQSGYNHALNFFPPIIAATCCAIAWLVGLTGETGTRRAVGWVAAIALVAGVFWQFLNYPPGDLYYSQGNMPSQTRLEMYQGLTNEINNAPGDILSEDIYLQMKTGRPVIYDDLYHMALQAREGQWDESKFLADLKARRFSVALLGLGSRRFTDSGWEALNANYSLIFPDGIAVWRPRPYPLLPQHQTDCTLGESFKIEGISYGRNAANGALTISSYWNVLKPVSRDYILYLHLLDENGSVVTQRDDMPYGWRMQQSGAELPDSKAGLLPTSSWKVNEWMVIDQTIRLSNNFNPAGKYRAEVGMYYLNTNGNIDNIPVRCTTTGTASVNSVLFPPTR